MDTDDSRPGGPPLRSERTRASRGADQLSRRQALQRLGLGVAGGAAAWAVPEILIGRPTAAGAASAAPEGRPGRPAGSGASPGGSDSGAAAMDPTTGPTDPAAGSTGLSAAGSSNAGGGAQLAFTGFDAERAVELGTGLLVGGWALTRWSSRPNGGCSGDQSAGQPAQPS